MKRFFSLLLALCILVPTIAQARLVDFYPEVLGYPMPSKQMRALDAAEVGVWGYIGTYQQNLLLEQRLRSMYQAIDTADLLGFSVVSKYRTTLQSSMTASQTTVPVSSITTVDGHVLTMDDLGGFVYLTIEPGSTKEEIVRCTSIASSQWADCTRGLAFYGSSEASVSANQKTHNAASTVVMSNVHYVYEQLLDKQTSQSASGTLNFLTAYPQVDAAVGSATSSRQLITLGQAQALAIQGAATSSQSVSGICRLATQNQAASSTNLGADDPLCIQTLLTTSSPSNTGSNRKVIPVTENDGKLHQTFIDLNDEFNFTNGIFAVSSSARSSTSTFTTSTVSNSFVASTTKLFVGSQDVSAVIGNSTTPAGNLFYVPTSTVGGTVSFTCAEGTTALTVYHGLGVRPTFMSFEAWGITSDGTNANTARSSGSTTSTRASDNLVIYSVNDEAGAPVSAGFASTTGAVVHLADDGAAVDFNAVVSSWTTTHFVLTSLTNQNQTGCGPRVIRWEARR